MATILIIDDDMANAQLLEIYLDYAGYDVHVEYTGMDGYAYTQRHSIHLVLTDLRMPVRTWTGYETATRFKSDKQLGQIPVVAVTASGDKNKALNAGCDDAVPSIQTAGFA